MSNTSSGWAPAADLLPRLGECASGFAEFAEPLTTGDIAEIRLGPLAQAWDRYYFGPFSRFDAMLRAYIDGGGRQYAELVPLSIGHHNLHRLMEALRGELGDEPLGRSRIPERLLDLVESCRRLTGLLGSAASAERSSRMVVPA
jgi:hypothetical protein